VDSRQKLFRVVADTFRVDVNSISESSSPDSIPGWDSLAMVNLVTELEEAFGVEFELLEIADFHNVGIIKSILVEKGIDF
jgi:acyl carrier protein